MEKNWWDSKTLSTVVASLLIMACAKLGLGPETQAAIAALWGVKVWKQGDIDKTKVGGIGI